jgi:hypothetical protein
MKVFVNLIIVVGLSLLGWHAYKYWEDFNAKQAAANAVAPAPAPEEIPGDQLPGMLPRLQPALNEARQRGAAGLHDFLQMYGNTIADPRRASIELDYVVLLAQSNPEAARKAFAKVKSRITSGSPLYTRVKDLEKTYD